MKHIFFACKFVYTYEVVTSSLIKKGYFVYLYGGSLKIMSFPIPLMLTKS